MNSAKWRIRTGIVLLGDLLMMAIFVVIGRFQHQEGVAISRDLYTFAPFCIAWVIVGTLFGMFRSLRTDLTKSSILHVAVAWPIAEALAMCVRHSIFHDGIAWPFIVVTWMVVFLFLVLWRIVVTLIWRMPAVIAHEGHPSS